MLNGYSVIRKLLVRKGQKKTLQLVKRYILCHMFMVVSATKTIVQFPIIIYRFSSGKQACKKKKSIVRMVKSGIIFIHQFTI